MDLTKLMFVNLENMYEFNPDLIAYIFMDT